MATVIIEKRKRASGMSYPIYYKDPVTGRRKYYKTCRRLVDAQGEANALRQLIDTGKACEIARGRRKHRPLTVEEACALTENLWQSRLAQGEMRPLTVSGYMTHLRAIRREFAGRMVFTLTREELFAYRQRLATEKSTITANRRFEVFSQVLKVAVREGALPESPLAGLRKLSEAAHRRTRFLQPDEIKRLLEACEVSMARTYLRVAILLAIEHGAAMQEVMDLTWDEVDLERGLIRFHRTKNGRTRTHDLMPGTRVALVRLRDHLKAERKKRGIDLPVAGQVLAHLNGRPRKAIKDAWGRTVERAGLTDYRFHDNRHTYCSNLMLAGLDLKDVKELIGHGDIRMTDRYSHLSPARKRQAQARLAEHYGQAVAVPEEDEEEVGTT